jgi:hypothetical protein
MKYSTDKNIENVDNTISQRTGVGQNELVQGWQSMLSHLLDQIAPYMKSSAVVTFQNIVPEERETFEKISNLLEMPDGACGVFLSPSVRNQMMYVNQGLSIPSEALAETDKGVLLFSRCESRNIIINTLLANPPYSASVDVYQDGGLLAGYVYDSIDDCLSSLSDIVFTHLGNA